MFYLRILHEGRNSNVENFYLGNNYRKVTNDFDCIEPWITKVRNDDPCCGLFIFPENGDAIPIYENNQSYIVTDNGTTYEKLNPVDIKIKTARSVNKCGDFSDNIDKEFAIKMKSYKGELEKFNNI